MEPLLHVVIPFVALVLLGVKPRKAAPLALLGVLPDLDALLLVHRSVSHSVVVQSLAWAPLLTFAYFIRPEYRRVTALGLLVLLSHPVVDVMGGSTPIFWPLMDTSLRLMLSLNGKVGEGVSLIPRLEVQRTTTVFKQVASLDYPLFTGEGLMVSLILLTPVMLSLLRERHATGRLIEEV